MAFGAIGLTTLRIDGFCPLQAADRAGTEGIEDIEPKMEWEKQRGGK